MRDDVVGQMRCGLDHAPGSAGRTNTATLAGVGDEEVEPAVGAAGAGKAVCEDTAFEIAAEFPLGRRWRSLTGAVIVKRPPRRQMCLTVR